MFWAVSALPLLILALATWLLSGLAVVRGVFRLTSGLGVAALVLPVGMVLHAMLKTDSLEVLAAAGSALDFRALLRIYAPDEGCVPYIPGIMEELHPTAFTFADSFRVTAFRRQSDAKTHSVTVDFSVMALRPPSADYYFALHLTRQNDSQLFQIVGTMDQSSAEWITGGRYVSRGNTFTDVPDGLYRLSIIWYDRRDPALQPLAVTSPTMAGAASEAVLVPSLKVAPQ